MTAKQLARLRARRNTTDFNRLRFMQFLDPEYIDEGELETSANGRLAAGDATARERPTVAWSNSARSRTGESTTGSGVSMDSPNEVRGAEDPTWCAYFTNDALHGICVDLYD